MFGDNIPVPPRWPNNFALPAGLYFQSYISAMHGGQAELERHLSAAKQLGVRMILHNGPRSIERNAGRYARLMRDAGHEPAFAFGLDGQTDTDSTRLTAREKGQIIGGVLSTTGAKLGVEDAEGGWDIDEGPNDETDEAGALALGEEARKLAPRDKGFILVDQLWFAIESHGDERTPVKPIGQGGSFRGFPSDEFAVHLDARFPQPYWCNNRVAHPKDAYAHMFSWMARDWAKHEAGLAKLDPRLVLPRSITVQGYGHERAPWELVHCLINWSDRPVFMWAEPYPTPFTLRCILAARKILSLGFKGPRAVANFQRSTNGRLVVDNQAGLLTFAELGV